MGQKTIPFTEREIWVTGTETGNEMVLECLDGTFCGIATVAMGRDTLEINFVFGECCFEVR